VVVVGITVVGAAVVGGSVVGSVADTSGAGVGSDAGGSTEPTESACGAGAVTGALLPLPDEHAVIPATTARMSIAAVTRRERTTVSPNELIPRA